MENLALTWEEVEEHLAGIPDLKASRLKRFFGQNHFFKIRYAPGEIIMPRGVCSDFAALHLRGKVRVLFNAPDFAVDKRERESWSRPGPLFRRLENWVLDRTDRLESDTPRPGLEFATARWVRERGWFQERSRRRAVERILADPHSAGQLDEEWLERLREAKLLSTVDQAKRPRPLIERLMGLTSALWNTPRSVTLAADPEESVPCEMLLIKRKALFEIDEQSKEFREHRIQNFLSDKLPNFLRKNPFFASDELEPDAYWRICQYSPIDLMHFEKGALICKQGDPVDGLYLLVSGTVRISRDMAGGSLLANHLGDNTCFGMACVEEGSVRTANVIAQTDVNIVSFSQEAVRKICDDFAPLRGKLFEELARYKSRDDQADTMLRLPPTQPPEVYASKLMQASKLMLIDLHNCTRCEQCVQACSDSHDGMPRMHKANPELRFGRWEVAGACVHCTNAPCQKACPVGAITMLSKGIVHLHRSRCIGCTECVSECPFDAIRMEQRTYPEEAPMTLEKTGFKVATKCDACLIETRNPPCVASCPYDAAYRGSPDELFPGIHNWTGKLNPD
ncbi:MAG: cyclic nucleotide-binding domain-containing protein [Planctomycetota bacterium]|nr:cyclic nucleotide-binding domain-containing protein [Planctomycetota bacterium]